jgi:hypothetical protein
MSQQMSGRCSEGQEGIKTDQSNHWYGEDDD